MEHSWLKNPLIRNMNPKKLALLIDLGNKSKGISAEKALPLLISTNAKMKQLGLSLSSEESELLVEVMSADMTQADKEKLQKIKQIIAQNKK